MLTSIIDEDEGVNPPVGIFYNLLKVVLAQLDLVTFIGIRKQIWVILRKTVQYLYLDEVGRVVDRCSVVKNLVGLEFVSRDILRIEMVINKPIDNLGLSDEARTKDTDSNCFHVLIST